MFKQISVSFFCIVLITVCFFCSASAQQHTEWLKAEKDTSYTTASDYAKIKKQFPESRIVAEKPYANVLEERNQTYCSIGSRTLKIDAFISKQKTLKPAIIIVHGGGWRSGDRSQHIPLAQRLAAEGYNCFTVEYRLSTEAFYPAAVYDIKTAVQWIRKNAKRYRTDSNKVAVLGFSAGGELAAFVGVTSGLTKFDGNHCNEGFSSKVQAVIDIDGTLSFVHPEAWETQNTTKINASSYWMGYPRNENLELWTEASPFTYAQRNKVPFLFLNSAVERMHAGRDDFKKIADQNGVYTEIKTFENTPHSFCLYEPWFDQTVSTILSFLKKVF